MVLRLELWVKLSGLSSGILRHRLNHFGIHVIFRMLKCDGVCGLLDFMGIDLHPRN